VIIEPGRAIDYTFQHPVDAGVYHGRMAAIDVREDVASLLDYHFRPPSKINCGGGAPGFGDGQSFGSTFTPVLVPNKPPIRECSRNYRLIEVELRANAARRS